MDLNYSEISRLLHWDITQMDIKAVECNPHEFASSLNTNPLQIETKESTIITFQPETDFQY